MIRFRDRPIRQKLLVTTLASSVAALALAGGGFLVFDFVQFRAEIREDLDAQIRIVGESSAAPLAFGDTRVAGETLAILRLRPRVTMACLYAADGRLFATYQRDAGVTCPSGPRPGEFDLREVHLTTPVLIDSMPIGRLYLHRELSDVYRRLRIGGMIVLGLVLLSSGAAFLIGARIQRSIVSPLLELSKTAQRISTSRDYSHRASSSSGDEIGVVVNSFNDMLDRIAERDSELLRANNDLKREVEERTRAEAERTAALARERDANRLKDEFLATLSHELRTPLNAVAGWARVLRSANVDAAMQERALESIERNARAQTRLIEDLLEISRIVTGKLRIQVKPVDLAPVVDAAVEVVRPAAAAKRIRLDVEIAARPATISGDADRLQQVIWNLLSNAVKFTPAGGDVAVRLDRAAAGYRLSVRDSGVGIEPRFLPYLFEAFRQADGSPSREHGGLGLGLAIAKQLVELHGGAITAQSHGLGRGATFEVSLPSLSMPATAGDHGHAPGTPAAVAADNSLLRSLHVLVVDDDADARTVIEAALRQYGATVTTAGSAAEALASIDRVVPDVLLSDIGMPHEDGYSLIRRLRARTAEKGGAIPAVALTAYASDGDRDAAMSAGFQAHVAKPFDPREVASLVARLCRGAPTRA